MKRLHALLVAILAVSVCALAAAGQQKAQKLTNRPERERQFMDWGLGIFIHWGVDSQLGSVISHSMVGASDEYLDRYISELPASFNPNRYDPDAWMRLARRAGARYVVFTTKHHSGFCMWDTDTTEFNVMNTPYGKDVVRQYVEACREHGLKVGFYFSPEDFHFLHEQGRTIRRRAPYAQVTNNEKLFAYNKRQLDELFGDYGPIDVCFLDAMEAGPVAQYIHRLQPDCVITRGEMPTPEQDIPEPKPGPWESCFTMGTQWQFKPTNEEYKSERRLIEMLIETRAKGGNLLLNVGPTPRGTIPFEQSRRLRGLGLWMFVNRRAIWDIRPCPTMREGDLWFTRSKDGETVYVFLTGQEDWSLGERRTFEIRSLRATPDTGISVLGHNGRVLEYNPDATPEPRYSQEDGALTLSVVRAQRLYNNRQYPNPVVVKLKNVTFTGEGAGDGG